MAKYPDDFYKGVSNKTSDLDEHGLPLGGLVFQKERDDQNRSDNNLESSINWNDDEGSLEQLFTQEKNGKPQFSGGAARFCRITLDRIISVPEMNDRMKYERDPLPENSYHGNLLLPRDLSKSDRARLSSAIAVGCFLALHEHPSSST